MVGAQSRAGITTVTTGAVVDVSAASWSVSVVPERPLGDVEGVKAHRPVEQNVLAAVPAEHCFVLLAGQWPWPDDGHRGPKSVPERGFLAEAHRPETGPDAATQRHQSPGGSIVSFGHPQPPRHAPAR